MGEFAKILRTSLTIDGSLNTIAWDPPTRQVFYPVPGGAASSLGGVGGSVLVFHADTHAQLSPLLDVGGAPHDMLVVR